jgi:hypothetical protein
MRARDLRKLPDPFVLHAQDRQWAQLQRALLRASDGPGVTVGGSEAAWLGAVFSPRAFAHLTSLPARPSTVSPTC